MLERTISTRSTTGVVASYMSGRSSSGDCDLAVDLLGAVVFRGQRQRDQARRAKERGAMVWLDPAEYERPHTRRDQLSLFGSGDPWADDQKVVGVVELLSPGVEVPAHDLQALDSAITSQSKWLDVEGGGRLSLALHWRWLTEGLADLLAALAFVDKPIAVAFGDTNHPLEHRGAVPGLAELSSRVADLMLVRCDMGAFGALAHGARVATIGTGTSVRHFVPSGSRAYGGGSSLPSAFVESLLDFRQAELLARLPSRLKPTCSSPCCDGANSIDSTTWTTSSAPPRCASTICTPSPASPGGSSGRMPAIESGRGERWPPKPLSRHGGFTSRQGPSPSDGRSKRGRASEPRRVGLLGKPTLVDPELELRLCGPIGDLPVDDQPDAPHAGLGPHDLVVGAFVGENDDARRHGDVATNGRGSVAPACRCTGDAHDVQRWGRCRPRVGIGTDQPVQLLDGGNSARCPSAVVLILVDDDPDAQRHAVAAQCDPVAEPTKLVRDVGCSCRPHVDHQSKVCLFNGGSLYSSRRSNPILLCHTGGVAGPCGSEAYSVKEVARLLGVSDQTVRTAAEDGRLPENWREGSGARAPYCFGKPAIDALDGVLPGSRLRRLSPDRNEAELVALVDRLRREAADERTRRALADQRVIFLEREVERLQGALRDVVERFTRPELPDGPDAR